MKRFNVFLLLVSLCIIPALAELQNDVIIMRDGTQIACLISEMSDSIVKYQRTDRPATILYTTPIKKIAKIVYQNGAVDNFEAHTTSVYEVGNEVEVEQVEMMVDGTNVARNNQQPAETENVRTQQRSTAVAYSPEHEPVQSVVIVKSTETSSANASPYVMRSGNNYYYNGLMMSGRVFNNGAYSNFLRQNCLPAYEKFRHGTVVAAVGWGLFIGGLIVDVGFTWWAPYATIVSLPCEIASIPMLIVGYCQMHKSAEIFNMTSSRRQSCYWSINSTTNGIGLAFNF